MKIKKRFVATVFALFLFYGYTFTQGNLINYEFETIDSLQKIENRNVVVFIHTAWCKYCKTMQYTTLQNTEIIKILNNKFYFVDLNAENHEDIFWGGQLFSYRPQGINTGIHELAEQLATMDKKINYPTLCILNPKYEIIFQYPQYMSTQHLLPILESIGQ